MRAEDNINSEKYYMRLKHTFYGYLKTISQYNPKGAIDTVLRCLEYDQKGKLEEYQDNPFEEGTLEHSFAEEMLNTELYYFEKYEKICQTNAENGSKANSPNGTEQLPNGTYSDSDSEQGSDSVQGRGRDSESDNPVLLGAYEVQQIISAWNAHPFTKNINEVSLMNREAIQGYIHKYFCGDVMGYIDSIKSMPKHSYFAKLKKGSVDFLWFIKADTQYKFFNGDYE